MIGGPLIVAIGFLQMGNAIAYLPQDLRAQPWFHPLIAAIGLVLGVILFVVGAVRLAQGLRDRER